MERDWSGRGRGRGRPDFGPDFTLDLGQQYQADISRLALQTPVEENPIETLPPWDILPYGNPFKDIQNLPPQCFEPLPSMTSSELQSGLMNGIRNELINKLPRNEQFAIICGETGSGKSTLSPRVISDLFPNEPDEKVRHLWKPIYVVVPRRRIAFDVSAQINKNIHAEMKRSNPHAQFKEIAGYYVRGSHVRTTDTKILFCTAGWLRAHWCHQPDQIYNMHCLVIDEIHERGKDTDYILQEAKTRRQVRAPRGKKMPPVILMSATMNPIEFIAYMFGGNWRAINSDPKEFVINLGGGMNYAYPVEELFLDGIANDCPTTQDVHYGIMETFNGKGARNWPSIYHNIHLLTFDYLHTIRDDPQYGQGAVICFLPGKGEIGEFIKAYNVWAQDHPHYALELIEFHSGMEKGEQQAAKKKADERGGLRKVIVCTNICESGVTFPTATLCINYCLQKVNYYNCLHRTSSLELRWASKFMNIQRRGRVGRTAPGRCVHMITEKFAKQFQDIEPEMQRCSFEDILLSTVKAKTIRDPLGLNPDFIWNFISTLPSPPKQDIMNQSLENLINSGCVIIDGTDIPHNATVADKWNRLKLTEMGDLLSHIDLDYKYIDWLSNGILNCTTSNMLILIAESETLGRNLYDHRELWNSKKEMSSGTMSDHMAVIQTFRTWTRVGIRQDNKPMKSRVLVSQMAHDFNPAFEHELDSRLSNGTLERMDDTIDKIYQQSSNFAEKHLMSSYGFMLMGGDTPEARDLVKRNERLMTLCGGIAGGDPRMWYISSCNESLYYDMETSQCSPYNSLYLGGNLPRNVDFPRYGQQLIQALTMPTGVIPHLFIYHRDQCADGVKMLVEYVHRGREQDMGKLSPVLVETLRYFRMNNATIFPIKYKVSNRFTCLPIQYKSMQIQTFQKPQYRIAIFHSPSMLGLIPYALFKSWENVRQTMITIDENSVIYIKAHQVYYGKECLVQLERKNTTFTTVMKYYRGTIVSTLPIKDDDFENEEEFDEKRSNFKILVDAWDAGISVWMPIKNIINWDKNNLNYGYPELFSTYGPLAYRCCIAGFQPDPKINSRWTHVQIAQMSRYLYDRETGFERYCYPVSPLKVDEKHFMLCRDLTNTDKRKDQPSFVQWCLSNNIGKKCAPLKPEHAPIHPPGENTCYLSNVDIYDDDENIEESNMAHLHSCLEVEWIPAYRDLEKQFVELSYKSVNTITLDPALAEASEVEQCFTEKGKQVTRKVKVPLGKDKSAYNPLLMVGDNVRQYREFIRIGNSSVLPAIPGIEVLLALLYSPVVQFIKLKSTKKVVAIRVFRKLLSGKGECVFETASPFHFEETELKHIQSLRSIKNRTYLYPYEDVATILPSYYTQVCAFLRKPRVLQPRIDISFLSDVGLDVNVDLFKNYMEFPGFVYDDTQPIPHVDDVM